MHFLRVSNLVLFTVPLYVAARNPLFYDSSGTVGVVRRMVALNKAGAVFEFIMEEEEPERCRRFKERAERFARDFIFRIFHVPICRSW